jgi:hypothetical protein
MAQEIDSSPYRLIRAIQEVYGIDNFFNAIEK